MVVTFHAYKRGNERLTLSNDSFKKLATRALENGIKHSDTVGRLNDYLTILTLSQNKAHNIRIYGYFIYLFTKKNVLLTVINLPNEYKKIVDKLKKKELKK